MYRSYAVYYAHLLRKKVSYSPPFPLRTLQKEKSTAVDPKVIYFPGEYYCNDFYVRANMDPCAQVVFFLAQNALLFFSHMQCSFLISRAICSPQSTDFSPNSFASKVK